MEYDSVRESVRDWASTKVLQMVLDWVRRKDSGLGRDSENDLVHDWATETALWKELHWESLMEPYSEQCSV